MYVTFYVFVEMNAVYTLNMQYLNTVGLVLHVINLVIWGFTVYLS